MDDAELVGGVLIDCADPRTAAKELSHLLRSPVMDIKVVRQLGLDPELVAVLRRRISGDAERIERACGEAAAWVLGRRSFALTEPWELVASLPTTVPLPSGLRRTTGETLISIVSAARRTIRLTAPFVDESALRFLADAIVAATTRRVHVEIFFPRRSTRAADAMEELGQRVLDEGDPGHLRVVSFRDDAPWAHLKVLTADSTVAYIGSANVTGPALSGPNLELGVLVQGPSVGTIERILEIFRSD